MQRQVATSLGAVFNSASFDKGTTVLNALTPDMVQTLSRFDSGLLEATRVRTITQLQTPKEYSSATENDLMVVMGKMPLLLGEASSETKAAFYSRAKNLMLNSRAEYDDLRVATIKAVSELGMKQVSDDGTLEQVALNDAYANTRMEAVKGLERLDSGKLSSLLPKLLEQERDPSARRLLEDMHLCLAKEKAPGFIR